VSSDEDLRGIRNSIIKLIEEVEHLKPLTDKSRFEEDAFTKKLSDVESALLECKSAYKTYIERKS
jgi:hypothetical protein